ncbi:MAG: hypothetical protein K1X89_18115 [Myxococcaceae bacterium]|nr:hypothetical protein [Myxococcaceae bacterium]
MKKNVFVVAAVAALLSFSACGPDASGEVPADAQGTVTGASSSSWPYPVPTGCVSISSTACRTNVGHYDVTEAERSLDANMAAAGYTKGYSSVCRTNTGYTKGSTKVCYRVGVVTDSNFQAIGSQWNGFKG